MLNEKIRKLEKPRRILKKKSRNPKRIQQTYVLKRGDTVEDPAGGTIDRHSVKSKFEEKRIS